MVSALTLNGIVLNNIALFYHCRSALSAVRPGGVVVYSTCTLSSSENYSVVETVLKDCPEAEPEDLWEELAASTSKYFTFFNPGGHTRHNPSLLQQNDIVSYNHNKLGILVVPQPGKTWGPMFLSRIKKKHPNTSKLPKGYKETNK